MPRPRHNAATQLKDLRMAFACLALAAGVLVASSAPSAQQPAIAPAESSPLVVRWIEKTLPARSSSELPKGSEDASLIYDPVSDRVILYGGKDDANLGMRETWAFDPAERTWEKLVTQGRTPPASEDHTTIYDPISHRMILFGGENGPTSNKLWSLDLKTAAWKELTSSQGPRRESHSAVYDSRGKRMVVFGGLDRTNSDLYDIWALDLDPASATFEKWQDLTVTEGRPPGRIDQAAVYDPTRNRLVFHGGWTKIRRGLFADTWAFYFADAPGGRGRWEKVATGQTAPPARRHAVPVHDPDRNLFILLGGQGQRSLLNDVWVLDLTRDVWMNATPGGPAPAGRIDHQAVYDRKNHSVLLYGGDSLAADAPKLRDVWELVLPPDSPLSSSRGAQ